MLEKTLESLLDCKETQPVHPKGNQSWVFTGKTNVEAETPILWPPDAQNKLIGKDPDAGKDWRWEEKGMKEDEIVGWYHRLNGHEFESLPGVGDGQGGLACCCSWGRKESVTTERLNWTELNTKEKKFQLNFAKWIDPCHLKLCQEYYKNKELYTYIKYYCFLMMHPFSSVPPKKKSILFSDTHPTFILSHGNLN